MINIILQPFLLNSKKAFEINKLQTDGQTEQTWYQRVTHQWFSSYLENRKQFVLINNVKSDSYNIHFWGTSGVGSQTKTIYFGY